LIEFVHVPRLTADSVEILKYPAIRNASPAQVVEGLRLNQEGGLAVNRDVAEML